MRNADMTPRKSVLPVTVLREIDEWVAAVSPRSARREFRVILLRVAKLAYEEGLREKGERVQFNRGVEAAIKVAADWNAGTDSAFSDIVEAIRALKARPIYEEGLRG